MDYLNAISFAIAILSLAYSFYVSRESRRQTQNLITRLTFQPTAETITWDQLGEGLDRIVYMLSEGPHAFYPDLLLGIGGGGMAIADMLSVRLWTSHKIRPPIYAANVRKDYRPRQSQPRETPDAYLEEWVKGNKILLVEDFFLGGESLMHLIERIDSHGPKELRILVFAVPARAVEDGIVRLGVYNIDYHCKVCDSLAFAMPWGRV